MVLRELCQRVRPAGTIPVSSDDIGGLRWKRWWCKQKPCCGAAVRCGLEKDMESTMASMGAAADTAMPWIGGRAGTVLRLGLATSE